MRQIDPDLELVVCGSSSAQMPTFGEWERVVLEETYDDIDFISCHAYYEPIDEDYGSFLASAVNMDRFIDSVVATADHVKAVRGSDKSINISFDEWNVWYQSRVPEQVPSDWTVAPRISEEAYTVADAVVVGNLLISLLRHNDRIGAACQAQLVNAIAPIRAEPTGPAWRQSTFHPFALTSRLAQGQVLQVAVQSPTYDTHRYGTVKTLDAVATHDAESGDLAVFVVNRHQSEAVALDVALRAFGSGFTVLEAWTISDDDLAAVNTQDDPDRVVPRPTPLAAVIDGSLQAELPPVSWTAIRLGPTP